MIEYKLYQDNRKNSQRKGKWYAKLVPGETVGVKELAEHLASHTSTFSKGEITGMLTDLVSCIRELCLDGYQVKIPDLAIFSLGISTKPANTAKEFAAKNIVAVKLRARATGEMTVKELLDKATVRETAHNDVNKEDDATATA